MLRRIEEDPTLVVLLPPAKSGITTADLCDIPSEERAIELLQRLAHPHPRQFVFGRVLFSVKRQSPNVRAKRFLSVSGRLFHLLMFSLIRPGLEAMMIERLFNEH